MTLPSGNKRLLFLILFICVASLCAQTKPSSKPALPPLSTHYALGVGGGGGAGPLVPMSYVLPGEPFEAHEDSRTFTVGPDGKPVVSEGHSILARDFDGRLYFETLPSPLPPGHSGSFIPHTFLVLDPVAKMQMTWSEAVPGGSNLPPGALGARTVTKDTWNPVALPVGSFLRQDACQGPHPAVRTSPRMHVTQQIKDLGTRMIDGVEARGCLVTNLLPGDPARKIPPDSVTIETWLSPALHAVLLSRHHDPRAHMDVLSQLDDLVLGDPDPNLFEPPPDYKIENLADQRRKEEAAEITLAPDGLRPDEFAGAWETEDPVIGQGVVTGFSLQIYTRRKAQLQLNPPQLQAISSGPIKVLDIQLRLYERDEGTVQAGWFEPNHDPWSTWDGHRLIVKYTGQMDGFLEEPLDLNLTFDPSGPAWVGTYTRNRTTLPIRLQRPGAPGGAASNPFVGAWAESRPIQQCLQIAEGPDGVLLAWEDRQPTIITAPPMPGAQGQGRVSGMIMDYDGRPVDVKIDGDSLQLTLPPGTPYGPIGGPGFFGINGSLPEHSPPTGRKSLAKRQPVGVRRGDFGLSLCPFSESWTAAPASVLGTEPSLPARMSP